MVTPSRDEAGEHLIDSSWQIGHLSIECSTKLEILFFEHANMKMAGLLLVYRIKTGTGTILLCWCIAAKRLGGLAATRLKCRENASALYFRKVSCREMNLKAREPTSVHT